MTDKKSIGESIMVDAQRVMNQQHMICQTILAKGDIELSISGAV